MFSIGIFISLTLGDLDNLRFTFEQVLIDFNTILEVRSEPCADIVLREVSAAALTGPSSASYQFEARLQVFCISIFSHTVCCAQPPSLPRFCEKHEDSPQLCYKGASAACCLLNMQPLFELRLFLLFENPERQVSLYSRRVQEAEPVIEDWPFAVDYTDESHETPNLAAADHDSSGDTAIEGGSPTESVTLFSPELLNVNVMEAHLSRSEHMHRFF